MTGSSPIENTYVIVEYELTNTLLKEMGSFNNQSLVPKINTTPFFMEVFSKYLLEDWKPLFIKVINGADDKVIGVFPLMYHINKRKGVLPYRVIKFFGSTFSDFHDIYAAQENRKLVIHAAFDWLFKNFRWQEMILDDFLDESNIKGTITEYLTYRNVNFSNNQGEYFYINLNRSWDEIESDTSKSFVWKNVRLAKNRITKAGSWEIEYNPNLSEDEILERLMPIHINRQAFLSRESTFKEQRYVSAYKEIIGNALKEDQFNTFWLMFEGRCIGYMIGFYIEGVFYWWSTAFLEEFKEFYPSRLLQFFVLKYMHQEQYKEFNFMRGESGYKNKWTKMTRVNHRFRIYNNKNMYGKLIGLFDKKFR